MFDLAIKGAKIVDGSRAPWYMGDVGVKHGKIVHIGRIDKAECSRLIEADGRVLAPGFIDIHSHYDSAIFGDPILLGVIRQGVTTVISGQCGDSRAPLRDAMIDDFAKSSSAGAGGAKIPYNWRSFREFLEAADSLELGVNMGSLVGHSTIRRCVIGVENRAPTVSELEEMKQLVDISMREGALGFSTGLVYAPGVYAKTPELIELAGVLKKYNAPYMTHLRSESEYFIEAIEETLTIARQAGVASHLAHHKALGKSNWHKIETSLKMVDEARANGLDITLDLYPYVLSTSMLRSILPPWVEEGGIDAMAQRLTDPTIRARVIAEIEGPARYNNVWKDSGGAAGVIAMDTRFTPEFEGKNMEEAALISGKNPLETALDIIAINKGWDTGCYRTGCEENIRRVIQKPYAMIGSDAVPCAPTAKCNPRTNGTFPRVLSKYVREEGLLSLEEGVSKMTCLPAARLNLKGKGLIKFGMDADLVIFDEHRVRDMADLSDPKAPPLGIDWVVISGIPVLENGIYNGKRIGKTVRRS